MRHNIIWTSAIALSFVLSSFSFGQEVLLDFRTVAGTDTTGSTLNGATGGSFVVPEATSLGLDPNFPFEIQILSVSNSSGGASLRSFPNEFGIQSGAGTSFRFDSVQQESLQISFSEDVFILEADFADLVGQDEFFQVTGGTFQPPNLPGRTFAQPDLSNTDLAGFIASNEINAADTFSEGSNDDIFDFTFGGAAPEGLFLPFGEPLELSSFTTGQGQFASASVGLQTLTVNVIPFVFPGGDPVVPEPNSMLALMGLAGLFVARRRR